MRDILRLANISKLILVLGLAALVEKTAQAADPLPRTLLFVDDEDILYRSGTEKVIEPLKKYEGNPVIAPDKPWDKMIGWVSVYRNPQTGKFQLWYQAYNDAIDGENKSLRCVVAYAESDDGKHWVKPNLGLFPYLDTKDTNIVLIGNENAYGDRYCNSVVVNPKETDPAKKYKMLYYDWDPDDEKNIGGGTRVAFSPDGIHWTKLGKMVGKTSYGAKGRQMPFEGESVYLEGPVKNGRPSKSWLLPLTMSDAQDVIYDESKGVYAGYGKMWMQGPDGGSHWKHGLGRTESRDFITWSKPQFLLGPNDNDPPQIEFHTSPVFIYNGQYFSLNQMLNRSQGVMDIELISSRDGLKFDRPFQGKAHFLERGTGAVFDAATLLTNSTPIPVGDDVYFYYGGYRGTAIGGVGLDQQKIGSNDYHSGIGLAMMKKDRFAAIVPDPEISLRNSTKVSRDTVGKTMPARTKPNTIGQVTLKPVDLGKVKEITVNADATGGKLYVELLNEDGYRIHGFSKDEATPISGNGLSLKASWKEKNLSQLKPGKYMLRVHLDNAKLYAVTLQ